MKIFAVFPTVCYLFVFVNCEECIIPHKVIKSYTIIFKPYYNLTVISVSTKVRQIKQNLDALGFEVDYSKDVHVIVKKYILSNSIMMHTGIICAYQPGNCIDVKNSLWFEWSQKKVMDTTENETCARNMMEYPAFRGMVEEWTVSYSPFIRFLILEFNNTKRILNLVKKKKICNEWLWTTDQDNVLVFESDYDLPVVQSNFSFKNFKLLEKSQVLNQEQLVIEENYNEDADYTLVKYLLLYLVLFVTFRFVLGIISNIVLLARVTRLGLKELLVLSLSQNLTNQKVFFREPENIKNVYAIAKSCEAVYESADNNYYRK